MSDDHTIMLNSPQLRQRRFDYIDRNRTRCTPTRHSFGRVNVSGVTHHITCPNTNNTKTMCTNYAECGNSEHKCNMYMGRYGETLCKICMMVETIRVQNVALSICDGNNGLCFTDCGCDCPNITTHGHLQQCSHVEHNDSFCPVSGWCCQLEQCVHNTHCGNDAPAYRLNARNECETCDYQLGTITPPGVGGECPVCYTNTKITKLVCGHYICIDCWWVITAPNTELAGIVRWTKKCPICRNANDPPFAMMFSPSLQSSDRTQS